MTLMTVQTLPPRVAVLPQAIEVVVTDEDSLLGQRRNGFECRFSRAIRRALVLMGIRVVDVCVGSNHTRSGYSTVSIRTLGHGPSDLELFQFDPGDQITAYDCSGNPPPCTVTLRRLEA